MKFDQVSVGQGLSNFSPFLIVQDKQGILWSGTEDELSRYDGRTLKIHNHGAQIRTDVLRVQWYSWCRAGFRASVIRQLRAHRYSFLNI